MTVSSARAAAAFAATLAQSVAAIASPAPGGSPSPATTAAPSPAADPCGGPARLLATANRPTVGFSTCAVQLGTAVFELGYQNQTNGEGSIGSVQSQAPQNFLRLGIARRFELDVIGPNYEQTRTFSPGHGDVVEHGVADYGAGFKAQLPPSGRWNVAFDGLYTPPNGSPFLTAGNATFTGNFDAAYAIGSSGSLGTTIAVSSSGGFAADGSHARYGLMVPSVVLTEQIPHYYQFYVEYVFVSKLAPDLGGRAFTDFGVQKLLGSRTEIDLEYGHAFTGVPALKFNYVGAGLVVQLR
jgi:hypothetical protein